MGCPDTGYPAIHGVGNSRTDISGLLNEKSKQHNKISNYHQSLKNPIIIPVFLFYTHQCEI
jgi:hypothetical protein